MAAECPHRNRQGGKKKPATVRDWWPDALDLRILHQDPPSARPSHVPHPSSSSGGEAGSLPAALSSHASYAERFSRLDLNALRNDIRRALTTSQSEWPADYGHYGPLLIRLAWHSAGTYRVFDGRGGGNSGNIRLAPLNSWPDNANLDKACRYVLWPIKKKYGQLISWADLIILAGNVAIESMMGAWGEVEPLWFGGGRVDAFSPEEDVYWGHEHEWLKDDRHDKTEGIAGSDETGLEKPLGAVQMGLIYVNPEGPGGHPDILASAKDVRTTFSRMGMTDGETVALIAGGHTFGKAHGAADPSAHVGPEPEGAPTHDQGLGWGNSFGSGRGGDTITSGLEGAWTANPIKWDNGYFDLLFKYDWVKSKSPGGATQWVPDPDSIATNGGLDAVATVPGAHDNKRHLPIMFTTDLALRYDPIYGSISKKFLDNPDEFQDAFKQAWYKLCHRDMGPKSRHLGPYSPKEDIMWMDPIPPADFSIITSSDVCQLEGLILDAVQCSKVSISDLVKAAWASASTYRHTDHRGGANGGRIRLKPQRDWEVNDPSSLSRTIALLEDIQREFNGAQAKSGCDIRVSFADLVVLGGNVAIEEAARLGGHSLVHVPFVPGRTDALQSGTDIDSFNHLEPKMDGFRNFEGNEDASPESALVDRAHLLTLTAPEMVALVGGLRVLGATRSKMNAGVLTDRPGALTNDFFVNLLDEKTIWLPAGSEKMFKGVRPAGKPWAASRVDLALGSNSQLRAISEAYACTDSSRNFVQDFVNAWKKVMMLDRFDLLIEKNLRTETTLLWMSKQNVSRL